LAQHGRWPYAFGDVQRFPTSYEMAYLPIWLVVSPWFVLSLVGGISIGFAIIILFFVVFYSSTLLGSIINAIR
jgi:hypothetical protein